MKAQDSTLRPPAVVRELWLLKQEVAALKSNSSNFLSENGFHLKPFTIGEDDEIWLSLNAQSFKDHPEQGSWSRQTFLEKINEGWFDPARFLLCFDHESQLAGCVWNKEHAPEGANRVGELFLLCVSPSHQGCGLGRALAEKSVEMMISDEITTAMVYTDANNLRAIALYRSLGFQLNSIQHLASKKVSL
jgi:mycothiol synthase